MTFNLAIAPDSFKGTLTAADAAAALARGWQAVRPADQVLCLPQADGGEGTMDTLAAAGSPVRHELEVVGADGVSVTGAWLALDEHTALTELAQMCGLTLLQSPDPLGAGTRGLGQVLADAHEHGYRRVLIGLGGSASTDGATGALSALGARFFDSGGHELAPGGAALNRLTRVDAHGLRRFDEVVLLTDVEAPLLGPQGAARVFGPQKGAGPDEVEVLEAGLRRLVEVVGAPADLPGMGAAGGCGYGFVALLGARIEPGAPYLARASGLTDAAATSDVLITGEGRFDATSLHGKVVGHALGLPGPRRRIVVAGAVDAELAHQTGVEAVSLSDLAGSVRAALAEPAYWLEQAGRILAGG